MQSLCITWASGLHKHGLPVQSPHVPFFFTSCLSDGKQTPVQLPPTSRSRVGKKTSVGGEGLSPPGLKENCCVKVRHAHLLTASHCTSFDLTTQLSCLPDSSLDGDIDGLRACWQIGGLFTLQGDLPSPRLCSHSNW